MDHRMEPKSAVLDLAAAIRRGDMATAEDRLDRLAEHLDEEADNAGEGTGYVSWVQLGRYSLKARP